MCGIIACIGENAYAHCLFGLTQLQNRGYDSAGVASIIDGQVFTSKYASSLNETAIDKLQKHHQDHVLSRLSIGHTRWATHGIKSDANSHPHTSNDGLFTLIHNGIVENYAEIKNMLLSEGYTFHSQTDTEVIVNLISYYDKTYRGGTVASIERALDQLKGTWGLVILCQRDHSTLYTISHGSPILIGYTDTVAMVASETSGFCGALPNYFVLKNSDISTIKIVNNKIDIHTTSRNYQIKNIHVDQVLLTPYPWEHWTIKEIHEQPDACLRTMSMGARLLENDRVKLGGLELHRETLVNIENLIILGCGTSFNSGMIGRNYMKDLANFQSVSVFDGGEFTSDDIPKGGKTALLLISQSGETKDLHRCVLIGKDQGLFLIGVVNVVDSLIAREVHCGCYLNAGREVAVASTKSYTCQIVVLSMIAIWFAQEKNINQLKRTRYISDLRRLFIDAKKTLETTEKFIDNLLPLFNGPSCFLLGKGSGEATAREGALKIKEISYIHAEGSNTSSLKHGPFALLRNDFPVVLIALDNKDDFHQESVYEELKSRLAAVIYITDKVEAKRDNMIKIQYNETFQNYLAILPIQILAYKLSVSRGINPDMPRNLAKVVTV